MSGWLVTRAAEDPPDRLRCQLRLRQEPGRRAFGDQLRIVRFGVRRDQHHFGGNPLTALPVAGQEAGEVNAAFVPALSLERNARRLEEGNPLQLAGFEEPENRQHSPVFSCALQQVELGKDAADVFLDRALGDEDPLGDARVGPALGHEGEHVALTWRQDIEWITPPASLDEFLHQGWIYHRGACGDPLDRLDELRYVGHPALQQVAEVLPA